MLAEPGQGPPAPAVAPAPPAPPGGAPFQARVQGEAARVQGEAARVQSEAARALEDELANVRDAVQNVYPSAPGAPGATPGTMGVVTNGDGKIVITARDGQQTILDPNLFRRDQIDQMVQQAFAPPDMPRNRDNGPPESVVVMVSIIMFFVTLMLIGFPLARARARRMDRQSTGAVPNDVAPRLERIEQAVESVALEMERVSEAQRFSARLLSERLPEILPRLDAAAEAAQRRRIEG